jgi:transcriptional regulator with XRE-family HTH domain
MSQMTESPAVPKWTLGWRLQRSLAHAGIGVQEMARELGVSRSTISRWMNDRGASPRSIYLTRWAARCGVPLEFITRREWSRRSMAVAA